MKMVETQDKRDERILILAPTGRDAEISARYLLEAGLRPKACDSIEELCAEMLEGAGMIFLTGEALTFEALRCLTVALAQQPAWSDIPLVVLTSGGSETPANTEVLAALGEAGNVTLIERPVRVMTLMSAVRSALRARHRQYDVREHLAAERRSKEALEQSEEKYRSLLENANDIIYSHDLQGNYLTINRACAEVTGYTREEILGGLNIAQVVVPEHLELAKRMTALKLRDPSPTIYEIDIKTKDGRRLTLEVSTRVSQSNDHGTIIEGIGRDVTERKRAEEALRESEHQLRSALKQAEEANRMKDEFLATLSHELRTPLTSILGWARMLSNGHLAEAETARALESIERNAKAQSQLIEDILDVSRIITGKLRLEVQSVDLAAVIESSIDAVLPAAEAKGIRLQHLLDSGASMVSGDPTRLQQVVWNLLSNAIKFTPRGGRVQVKLERINSHVEIVVSDDGQGISPDVLPFIFERFRQADSTMTRAHGGLGLGLAIVRHLVEMHGGTVEVESPGEGHGATFIVKLPLIVVRSFKVNSESNAERVHPTSSNMVPFDYPPELDGLRLLVVDDEEDTRTLLKIVLEKCGASVITASSAHEAIAALKEWRPDVLISDLGMPEEDGYSLIKKVRALSEEDGGKTPSAALTAYARAEDRMKVLLSGFQIHIPKPVEPAELVAVVANLAGRILK